jgi:hypothetical protein
MSVWIYCLKLVFISNVWVVDVANEVIKSLHARAEFVGEVSGLLKVLTVSQGDLFSLNTFPSTIYLPIFHYHAVSDFIKSELKTLPLHLPTDTLVRKMNPVLQRCAAFIVTQPTLDDELLSLLCWTPFKTFTSASIDTAVPVWNWIMSSRPDLNSRVLGHFLAIWEDTVFSKKGIYAVENG